MRTSAHEVRTSLYALPSQIPMLDAARGTILVLDWRAFRALGIYTDYEAALEPQLRAAVLGVTAGQWVPLHILLAHYRALDRLALNDARAREVGHAVGEGVHGAFIATLVRLAGKLGVSPWLPLEQCYKLWVRSWRGGGITVYRLADRIAEVVLVATPVCTSSFFCCSFGGALAAGIEPFARTVSVHEVAGTRTSTSNTYRLTWEG